jgi:hypothetical protein
MTFTPSLDTEKYCSTHRLPHRQFVTAGANSSGFRSNRGAFAIAINAKQSTAAALPYDHWISSSLCFSK